MRYQGSMMEALMTGDERRIKAIQRLNTSGSYRNKSWDEEINDKLIALSGRNSHEIYADSFPKLF